MPDVEPAASEATISPLTDVEVVRRVLDGDSALFEVIMRRYNQRLYRVARGILGDDSQAEDVIQQAYVNAYFHLDQFAERARFSTWLTKIAINEALARTRRRRSDVMDPSKMDEQTMDDLQSTLPDPEHQAFAGELGRLLEAAVEALPESYRVVFMLREIEGLSTAETADCLDIGEGTVKTRLHRARGLLRDDLYTRAGVATSDGFQFHASRCDRVVANVFERIRLERLANCELPG
jgi:RNA polymerase sigma-70 factor, ECF subfamily